MDQQLSVLNNMRNKNIPNSTKKYSVDFFLISLLLSLLLAIPNAKYINEYHTFL